MDGSIETLREDLGKVRGWVYVMSHPNMPGMLKVGQSSHDPSNRASELYTTGLPSPFDIEYGTGRDSERNLAVELAQEFDLHP